MKNLGNAELFELLGAFEDDLLAQAELPGHALLVASITKKGIREFLCYATPGDECQSILNQLLAKHHTLQATYQLQENDRWAEYRKLLSVK